MKNAHVMILAGEASGDAHAAEFVARLKQLKPDIRLTGMGSQAMRNSGVQLVYDSSTIAVVGLIEVIKHWRCIHQAMATVRQTMQNNRPDLLVLVDYPEFNLKMARHAQKLGIKVLFYISPQIWAWRPKRIHKIGRLIDHMAVIFEFEIHYYQNANIPVSFVGNPLVDKVVSHISPMQMRSRLKIGIDAPVVGLFPGSRNSEIARLLPLMLETATAMKQQNPDLIFVMPVADTLDFTAIKHKCRQSNIDIRPTRHDIYDVISCCDAIISCSGTVTLEIALLEVPLCIIYKISWLSYQIMRRLIKIPYIGLANIIAEQKIVQEYIQDEATVDNISREIFKILQDRDYRRQLKNSLSGVKAKLGKGNGAENMARLVLAQLNHC